MSGTILEFILCFQDANRLLEAEKARAETHHAAEIVQLQQQQKQLEQQQQQQQQQQQLMLIQHLQHLPPPVTRVSPPRPGFSAIRSSHDPQSAFIH